MAVKRGSKRARPGLLARLRAEFLTGLAVVLPVGLTIGLVWWAVGFIDNRITPLVPAAYNPETYLERDIAGFGLVVFLVFTTLVGQLTKGFVGRRILRIAEGWVDRLPVVRSLYNGLKQIVETVFAQSDQSFRQTCLIEYPRKGSWALAFISADARGELPVKAGEPDLLAVFMPTKPHRPDEKPPARKANGAKGCSRPKKARASRIASIARKTAATTLYCRAR